MEWISVKDELPIRHEKVIVAQKWNGKMFTEVAHFTLGDEWLSDERDETGELIEMEDSDTTVTHWMPLPPPPKAEGK